MPLSDRTVLARQPCLTSSLALMCRVVEQVFFKGKEVTGFKPHQMVRLGVGRSFQITSTFNRLTAFQNIRMGVLSRRGVRFNLFQYVDKMKDITQETNETPQADQPA